MAIHIIITIVVADIMTTPMAVTVVATAAAGIEMER
jgi:hypothetical protein